MSLKDFLSTLDALEGEASCAFDDATDPDALESARVRYMGQKKGALRDVQKQMGTIDKTDRKAAGMRLNQFKSTIHSAFEASKARLGASDSVATDPTFDSLIDLAPDSDDLGQTRNPRGDDAQEVSTGI